MKKLILVSLLALSSQVNASTYVMCHFNSFTAQHSQSLYPVSSTHDVVITNTANTNKTYHVQYLIYINKNLSHIKSYDVTIAPNGTYKDSQTETSMQKFPDKRNLSASCETTVAGAEYNVIKGGGNISIT